jgi:predicted DNA-binding WGR domain protein
VNVLYYLILEKVGNKNKFYEISVCVDCIIMKYGTKHSNKFIILFKQFDNKNKMEKICK